jgi:hypothetical protein
VCIIANITRVKQLFITSALVTLLEKRTVIMVTQNVVGRRATAMLAHV